MRKSDIYKHLKERDGLLCGICGDAVAKEWLLLEKWWIDHKGKRTHINIDIDHIVPKSLIKGVGWWADLNNLQLTHRTCNKAKGNKLKEEL